MKVKEKGDTEKEAKESCCEIMLDGQGDQEICSLSIKISCWC